MQKQQQIYLRAILSQSMLSVTGNRTEASCHILRRCVWSGAWNSLTHLSSQNHKIAKAFLLNVKLGTLYLSPDSPLSWMTWSQLKA
jgi:hypothetical protein